MELHNYKIFIQDQISKNGFNRYDKQRYAMKLFWYLKKIDYAYPIFKNKQLIGFNLYTLKDFWEIINSLYLDKWKSSENSTGTKWYYENAVSGTYTGD